MQERQINIQGLTINYRETGEGPCVLILHGWGASSIHWIAFEEIAAQKGCRVIVPDLPGFGKSDPPRFPWSLMDYANFTSWFAEVIGPDKFYLLGHSFGGRIATKFAKYYPEKLQGIILVDSAGVTPRSKLRIFLYRVLTKVGDTIFFLPILSFFRPFARRIIYWIAGTFDFYRVQGVMKEVFKTVIAEDLTPYLKDIKTKTLIVWGEDDKMTPLSDAYLIHREISGSKLIIISDVGHSPNLQVPDKLAEIISDFINQ